MRSWLAPAPSQVTISRRRCFGGKAAIASPSTAMWSAAVLDPAEPGRSIPASGSPVLSHQQPNGCRPKPLKLGSAPCFSNPHRFAGTCARCHLRCPGSSAGDGALEPVTGRVAGEVADQAGALHAVGGGGGLGVG